MHVYGTLCAQLDCSHSSPQVEVHIALLKQLQKAEPVLECGALLKEVTN